MERTPAKRKFNEDPVLVSLGESGKGLPYAPVDWLNPGDTWQWATTGKAIKRNGMYKDRLLYAPETLQRRSSKKLAFMSKISVERYLRSEFPEADIDAFFQSFTWDIPAKTDSGIKELVACPQAVTYQEENWELVRSDGIFKRTRQSSLKQKSRRASGLPGHNIDLTTEEEGTLAGSATTKWIRGTGFQEDQVSDSHAAGTVDGNVSHLDCKLKAPSFTPDDFDNYLNSLDGIFALPHPTNSVSSKGGDMTAVRRKLSSLLAMGFPSLALSYKLNELLDLTSELENDPNLSDEELSILKLIQEIPSTGQRYLEVKKASTGIDKFFADLDSKIVSVTSLKSEYIYAKEEKEVLQAEEASTMLAILECNEEIAKLQAQRRALAESIKVTNRRIVQCDNTLQKVMDCLPKIVDEVYDANSEKAVWELKKKKLAEEEDEILAKFAPLMGFSF